MAVFLEDPVCRRRYVLGKETALVVGLFQRTLCTFACMHVRIKRSYMTLGKKESSIFSVPGTMVYVLWRRN